MLAHKHLRVWVLLKTKGGKSKVLRIYVLRHHSAKCQMNKPQAPGSYTSDVQQLYVTVVWKQMCVLS
jgi:hypothetical protein